MMIREDAIVVYCYTIGGICHRGVINDCHTVQVINDFNSDKTFQCRDTKTFNLFEII